MDQDWDKYIETLAQAVSTRENYQRLLGQVALEVRRTRGMEALKNLVEDIKERHGLVISWKTLHNYAWVEERLTGFEIPEDVPYRLRQTIAGTEDPQKWIDKIHEGLNTSEIIELIKGKSSRPLIECPKCHFAFEKPTYEEAIKKAKEETKDFQY